MGQIRIGTSGSFSRPQVSYLGSAMHCGHAVAVYDAIAYLRSNVLPAAVLQDAQLREEGAEPGDKFSRLDAISGARPTPEEVGAGVFPCAPNLTYGGKPWKCGTPCPENGRPVVCIDCQRAALVATAIRDRDATAYSLSALCE